MMENQMLCITSWARSIIYVDLNEQGASSADFNFVHMARENASLRLDVRALLLGSEPYKLSSALCY